MTRIDHYDFGRIVIDGREETRDLIILPDRVVRDWWRQEGHVLVVDDLGEVWRTSFPLTWSWGPVPPAGCSPIPTRSSNLGTAA